MFQPMRVAKTNRDFFDVKRRDAPLTFALARLSLRTITHLLCACTAMFAADAALACWDVAGVVPSSEGNTPQRACEYASTIGRGFALSTRLAWLREGGQEDGFYRAGFEVAGPALPNAENNYQPYTPSKPYCIIAEASAYTLHYYKLQSCDAVPKIIAIDPGHGYACASKNMLPGAIGVTNFPASDPPPGNLKEDELTMAIALEFRRLASPKYTVVLTKNSVEDCPKFEERGETAIDAKADVFVSVHINARNFIPSNPVGNGTSVIYNYKRPFAKTLADLMAVKVSASLGVNNRGAMVDNGLAVLKDTVTPKMTAVLVEAGRLSGDDEKKLHTAGSATKVAAGIKAALDTYFGN